jgi:hypothetical protein
MLLNSLKIGRRKIVAVDKREVAIKKITIVDAVISAQTVFILQ